MSNTLAYPKPNQYSSNTKLPIRREYIGELKFLKYFHKASTHDNGSFLFNKFFFLPITISFAL